MRRYLILLIFLSFNCFANMKLPESCPEYLRYEVESMNSDVTHYGSKKRVMDSDSINLHSVGPCRYQDKDENPTVFAYISRLFKHSDNRFYAMDIPYLNHVQVPTSWSDEYEITVYSSALTKNENSYFAAIRTVYSGYTRSAKKAVLQAFDSGYICQGHGGSCGSAWLRRQYTSSDLIGTFFLGFHDQEIPMVFLFQPNR